MIIDREKLTPMMLKYVETKDEYPDEILFYRLGDFYEMFFDDALTAAPVMGVVLTRKSCGLDEPAPMCGVPFHAADGYISKLISGGFKVAVCEQVEDPKKAVGLVKREVVRVITPGTALNDDLLSSRLTNYMSCVFVTGDVCGITFCELSTGEISATSFSADISEKIIDELSRFSPVEVIYNIDVNQRSEIVSCIKDRLNALNVLYNDVYFSYEHTQKVVSRQFGTPPEGLDEPMTCAVGALITYITQTQMMEPSHIKDIEIYTSAQYMAIDASARRNLEIVENMQGKGKRNTLFWVMDDTKTSIGARTLKRWLLSPLVNCARITARQNAVEELFGDLQGRDEIQRLLSCVTDIERIISRVVLKSANARELAKLRETLEHLHPLRERLSPYGAALLRQQADMDPLDDIYELLSRAIADEPPLTLREGGMIREGYSEELDVLRQDKQGGDGLLAKVEREESEATGIKNLKVGYNKVFGYYIEISKANEDKVPPYYIRKQTVANGERYITPRLKEIEGVILGAAQGAVKLEYDLFCDIRDRVAQQAERIKKTARCIGVTDALCSMASVAVKNNYKRPAVDMGTAIEIRGGRHPVVEKVLGDSFFVPNDTEIDSRNNRLAIITGPNMAGKSTYMRQIALIALMAQAGSFVPADSCKLGVVDKLFTRVGASDDLSAGQSTFMVEMSEVAYILKNATEHSLLILDEIGRGTSTYDGLAIAWAVLEECALRIGAKALFATHYHELTQLEDKLSGVVNFSVAVKKREDDIIFLRKIIRGGADDSYGVEVAKLAGVPKCVTDRAKAILRAIESESAEITVVSKGKRKMEVQDMQMGFANMAADSLALELKKINPEVLTPIEAMTVLYEIVEKAKKT